MIKKDIYKKALRLAVPMMIQNGITNMVGLIDNIMVGSIGTEAMTAVSIVGQLIFVFNLAIFGGISGPGIYGAQYYGKGNEEGFKNTFRIKIWICLLCLAAGILAFSLGGEQLINLYLRGESENIDAYLTLKYAKEYLAIMMIGMFPFVFTQIYASSLRETGNSLKPMVAGVASVVVDILLNYILIYGKFGAPKLGVEGAAIATVISRFVEALIVIIWAHLTRRVHTFLIGIYKTILVPKDITIKMIKKGFPIFLNEFLWAGGIAVLTQCYSVRGLDVVAGLNISNAICNLLNVVFVALGNAVGIIIGQTLGAGKYEDARKNAFHLMWFTGAICLILTTILISVSKAFPGLYNTTEEIQDIGRTFIILTALFFPVQGFLNAMYFTLRSGGKTLITFVFDSIYSWVVTVPIATTLCFLTELPVYLIYVIVQSADIIKVCIGYILIRKGVWITNIVKE